MHNVKKSIQITLLALFFSNSKGIAQKLYIHSSSSIYQVDLKTCESSLLANFRDGFLDIAFCPVSKKMYAIEYNFLYEVDLSIPELRWIYYDIGGNSLTCDENDILFASIGRSVYKINPITGSVEVLTRNNNSAGGDFTFYNGDLLLATSDNKIVQYDKKDINTIKRITQIQGLKDLYGLASVADECKQRLYLMADRNIYELNSSFSPTLICENVTDEGSQIYGAASESELFKEPQLDLGEDIVLCQGEEVVLNAENFLAKYSWQDKSEDPTFLVNKPGMYSVNVQVDDCFKSDTIEVDYKKLPTVDLGENVTLCQGDTLQLNAHLEGALYQWSDSSTNSNLYVTETGKYTVKVILDGCSNSDEVNARFDYCPPILSLPNIITPNGDGINEAFTPIDIENVRQMDTSIYNRWGERVYKTNKKPINWTAENVVNGIYYYVIEYVDRAGKQLTKKGWLKVEN